MYQQVLHTKDFHNLRFHDATLDLKNVNKRREGREGGREEGERKKNCIKKSVILLILDLTFFMILNTSFNNIVWASRVNWPEFQTLADSFALCPWANYISHLRLFPIYKMSIVVIPT